MPKFNVRHAAWKRIKNVILTLKSIVKHPGQESDNLPPSNVSAAGMGRPINFSGFQVPANDKFEKDDAQFLLQLKYALKRWWMCFALQSISALGISFWLGKTISGSLRRKITMKAGELGQGKDGLKNTRAIELWWKMRFVNQPLFSPSIRTLSYLFFRARDESRLDWDGDGQGASCSCSFLSCPH